MAKIEKKREKVSIINLPASDWAVRRAVVRKEIRRICTGRFVTREELSEALGLSVNTVRSYYIYPMIEQGELQYRYPDYPTRKGQAYQTKQ